MCTLALLAGKFIGCAYIVPTIGPVDVVVHTQPLASGQRRVSEIAACPAAWRATRPSSDCHLHDDRLMRAGEPQIAEFSQL